MPNRNNRIEYNAHNTEIAIVEARFIFRFKWLLLDSVCICEVFDFSALFHAVYISVLLLFCMFCCCVWMCYCRFFFLFKNKMFAQVVSRMLTVFYRSVQYILYQYSNKHHNISRFNFYRSNCICFIVTFLLGIHSKCKNSM